MASKRKPKPPGRRSAHTVFARINLELGDRLAAYLESTKPRPSVTAVIETALEEFLEKRGVHRS